ncbi:hypothetical protein U1769_01190 [Sphingomonas sp. ZT3P38]|uniref:hypothetical protein n=1 Tax=Parasphingomonas zepuensis TaxID=3096161 RepID=UPI002FC60D2D
MRSMLETCAAPAPYRRASILLLLASFGLPIVLAQVGGPYWLGFLLGAPAYVLLTMMTYRRLRDGAFSGAWVGLMIVVLNVGPSWDGPGPLIFHLGNVILMIPVLLAWIIPTDLGANPRLA